MKYHIIGIGKLKEDYLTAGLDEFLKRLRPYGKVELTIKKKKKMTLRKKKKRKKTQKTQNSPKPYETKTIAPAKTSVPKTQTKKNEKKNKDVDFAGSIP